MVTELKLNVRIINEHDLALIKPKQPLPIAFPNPMVSTF